MLKRVQVVKRLRTRQAEIQAFGVKSLALFGSVARDEAGSGSDVDLLVEFTHPIGLFQFIGLKQYLENILGTSVDLGTPNSIRPLIKDSIMKDAIYVI